jgi:isopentenyl-diphosphate delta-isomerase
MLETGTNNVVLVDENDRFLGTMEKLQAHREGRLHRAFSVVIFNQQNEILIHKRAKDKYHCGGLWTNACCSHPRENETPLEGAKRRLQEEMGFSTALEFKNSFIYKVKFDNGLFEHELDHLFIGSFDGQPKPNKDEVEDFRFISLDNLALEVENNPDDFTFWFKEILKKLI